MASALSEADGVDYTDPEEVQFSIVFMFLSDPTHYLSRFNFSNLFVCEQLELLITTLIDLDAMDGKQSVSLLAECSSSPNDSTR